MTKLEKLEKKEQEAWGAASARLMEYVALYDGGDPKRLQEAEQALEKALDEYDKLHAELRSKAPPPVLELEDELDLPEDI